MKKILVYIVIAMLVSLGIGVCSSDAAPPKTVTLKATFHFPPTHSAVVHAVEAFSNLEKLTDGRVKLDIYHSATLVKPPEVWDAINRGIADFASVPLPYFRSGLPWWGVEMLPGGLKDYKGMHDAAMNGMLDMYQEALHSKGMKITLSHIFCPGLAYIMTKGKRVATPEDMKGLKIQAAGPREADMIKAVGGAPVIMSHSEVYEALMTGLLDGTMGNMSSFGQYKAQEPAEYLCMQPFGGPYVGVLVSETGLAQLSNTDLAIFLELAIKYGLLEELFFAIGSERLLSERISPFMKEIVYPTPEQSKKWDATLAPMIDSWKEKAGEQGQKALNIIYKYNK
jgi:TRAP-type C4-dicarboxylate transport system substrate-binding protein